MTLSLRHSGGALALEHVYLAQNQLQQRPEDAALVLPPIKQALAAAGSYTVTISVG